MQQSWPRGKHALCFSFFCLVVFVCSYLPHSLLCLPLTLPGEWLNQSMPVHHPKRLAWTHTLTVTETDRYTHDTDKYKDVQIIYIPQTKNRTQFKYLFGAKHGLLPDHSLSYCLVEVEPGGSHVSTVLWLMFIWVPVPSIQIHLCIPYSGSEHLLSVITLEAFAFFTRPVSTVSVWSPSACILPRALLSVTVLQRVFFVWACSSVRDPRHMRVARRPYDKWLPGWLKRTLSLHNEHRRSISHCLWGKPGTSAAKLSVIPRNSTNVD